MNFFEAYEWMQTGQECTANDTRYRIRENKLQYWFRGSWSNSVNLFNQCIQLEWQKAPSYTYNEALKLAFQGERMSCLHNPAIALVRAYDGFVRMRLTQQEYESGWVKV